MFWASSFSRSHVTMQVFKTIFTVYVQTAAIERV